MLKLVKIVRPPTIKVFGVGGAGNNGMERMISNTTRGVELIAVNSDIQALARSSAPFKLLLGKTGLGGLIYPDKGEAAASENSHAIRAFLKGADMAILIGGMGGGTGSGALPVLAKIAREMKIVTIGVVYLPFEFEGTKRNSVAKESLKRLSQQVNALIVLPQDQLMNTMGDETVIDQYFIEADAVLSHLVRCITDISHSPGLVNPDFEDVRTVFRATGRATIGMGTAEGTNRAAVAAENAIANQKTFNNQTIDNKALLVSISASKSTLAMSEVNQAMNAVRLAADDNAQIVFGAAYDESLLESLRVTIIAISAASSR